MKKILYILLFSIAAATSFTACTEEEITPSTELDNGGTTASDDPIRVRP
jgi:hypothetical protein